MTSTVITALRLVCWVAAPCVNDVLRGVYYSYALVALLVRCQFHSQIGWEKGKMCLRSWFSKKTSERMRKQMVLVRTSILECLP